MDRKEAIEIIKKNWPKDIMISEALQTLIPELKESEDERIKKAIRSLIIASEKNGTIDGIIKEHDALVWLEKQGEHIKFLESVQIGDEVTRNPDGVLVNLSQFKRKAEQGSQNLANSAKTCKDEQKPAWSEEDEHRITDTIYFLDTAKKHYAGTEELDNCIDWLKSLKERYTWKPSEEQMSNLQYLCEHSPHPNPSVMPLLVSLYNDLKKLKG